MLLEMMSRSRRKTSIKIWVTIWKSSQDSMGREVPSLKRPRDSCRKTSNSNKLTKKSKILDLKLK